MPTNLAFLSAAVHLTVGLFVLVFVVQMFILPTLADGFRQRIFALRRELFLFMSTGVIQPDHPAYTHLRTLMNGLIQHAEQLTLMRLAVVGVTTRGLAAEHRLRMQQAFAAVPDERVRQQLLMFQVRIGLEIGRHMVTVSPVAWLGIVVAIPCVVAAIALKGVKEGFRLAWDWPGRIPVESIEAESYLFARGDAA